MTPATIWIFGCFGRPGHRVTPSIGAIADPPPREVEGRLDLPGYHYAPQPEGERTHVGSPPGWSYVSWWDRQGDRREGSHTGVLARGGWTPAQLVAAARRLAPWAIRVPLGTWAGEVSDG